MNLYYFLGIILLTLRCQEILAVGDIGKASHFAERRDRVGSRCPRNCTCEFKKFTVNCSKRWLTDVPPNVPYTTRFLFLNKNKITTLGEPAIYQNLRQLQVLDISRNSITTFHNAICSNLGHLKVLDLSNNMVNVIDSDAFVGLSSLQCLSLSFNPLPHLQYGLFSPLVSLTELKLDSTHVAFVPEAFLNLTNLRRFVFRHNRLLEFPKFLYGNASLFPKLVELNLDGNSLESVSSSGLDSLQFLTLGSNKIDKMRELTLSDFKSLKT